MARTGRARPVPVPSAEPAGRGVDATPILLAVLGACLGLRVLASFSSSNWLWGLNTLRPWPVAAAVALTMLAAAGFVPAFARTIGGALHGIGAAWAARPARGDAIVTVAVFVLVLSLRDPVLFVGDFALRAGALSLDVPMVRLFPQSFPLDLALNIHLPRALAGLGLGPLAALQVVGATIAALFTLAALAFLRSIGARGASLPAAALVLIGGGYLVHFAGYDKYGPLLVGIVLAAAGAAKLSRGEGGAWTLAAGTAICLLSTRLGYAILPPALLAFLLAWRQRTKRAAIAAAAGATLLVALAMLPRTLDIVQRIDSRVHMPGGAVGRTLEFAGAPDLLVRLSGALNLLFFLVPLWPAGLVVLLRMRRDGPAGARGTGLGATAALAVAIQLAIVFVVRGPQGVARDWDAYVGAGLVVALVTTAALVSLWREPRKGVPTAPPGPSSTVSATAPAAVSLALSGAVTLWGLHASESLALRRIDAQLAASPMWSETARVAAHDNLGLRALRLGRFEEAARHFESATAIAPNPRFRYQAGLAYLGAMQLDRAEDALRASIPHYPASADPWVGLARVALARGDSLGATTCLDSALARDPRNVEATTVRQSLIGAPGKP